MSKVILINGPNLNTLGQRQPEIYGYTTLNQVQTELIEFFASHNVELLCIQSNHEGVLIDFLQQHKNADGIIINPGGLTHTSVILRDALLAFKVPFFEVHISNIYSREEFRHHSYLSAVAQGVICGCGVLGYNLAAQALLKIIKKDS